MSIAQPPYLYASDHRIFHLYCTKKVIKKKKEKKEGVDLSHFLHKLLMTNFTGKVTNISSW